MARWGWLGSCIKAIQDHCPEVHLLVFLCFSAAVRWPTGTINRCNQIVQATSTADSPTIRLSNQLELADEAERTKQYATRVPPQGVKENVAFSFRVHFWACLQFDYLHNVNTSTLLLNYTYVGQQRQLHVCLVATQRNTTSRPQREATAWRSRWHRKEDHQGISYAWTKATDRCDAMRREAVRLKSKTAHENDEIMGAALCLWHANWTGLATCYDARGHGEAAVSMPIIRLTG